MRAIVVGALGLVVACGGSRAPEPPPTGSGDVAACEAQRAHLEAIYRVDAEAREPERVEAAVADNVAMVLIECRSAPARVAPCVAGAADAAAVEARCLTPLDDEGSEGDQFRER
ncbi:MAG: hypothetical protein R2939_17985 [Kofleriaceae bacterium]